MFQNMNMLNLAQGFLPREVREAAAGRSKFSVPRKPKLRNFRGRLLEPERGSGPSLPFRAAMRWRPSRWKAEARAFGRRGRLEGIA